MPPISKSFRFYYVASNFASGLIDVSLNILDPNGTVWGPYSCAESNVSGIYYYDFTPATRGQYIFKANSITTPKQFVQMEDFEEETGGTSSNIPFAQFDN